MASETVRISNMPDSGSNVRVAYDMANRIWGMEAASRPDPTQPRKAFLDLYVECLNATFGQRTS